MFGSKLIARFMLLVSFLIPIESFAACQVVSQVCLDSTPCKTINGATVCLAGATLPNATSVNSSQTCWRAESVYSCDSVNVNTCQTYVNQGCSQVGSTCVQTDPTTGACALYDQTYSCFYPSFTAFSPYNDCAPLVNKGCSLMAKTCLDTAPTGATLAGTGLTSSTSTAVTSTCSAFALRYSCETPVAGSTTTQCGSSQSLGKQTFAGFTKIVAGAEAIREGGKYLDQNTKRMFVGYDNRCTQQLWAFGAGNCCSPISGAPSNNAGALKSIASNPGLVATASKYTYDLLFTSDSPVLLGKGLTGAISSAMNSSGTLTTITIDSTGVNAASLPPPPGAPPACITCAAGNAIGSILGQQAGGTTGQVIGSITGTAAATYASAAVSAMYTGAAASASGTAFGLTMTTTAAASGAPASMAISFDPWSLALTVLVMVIMSALACPPEMAVTQQKLGQNLCHEVGTRCTTKTLFGCSEDTKTYCCFNSKLARILNEQGRPQIGKGWGSTTSPNCEGYTTSELQSLDFDKMDLSEFMADITTALQDQGKSTTDITKKVMDKFMNAPQ